MFLIEPGKWRAHIMPWDRDMVKHDHDGTELWRIQLSDPAVRDEIFESIQRSVRAFQPPMLREHERYTDVIGYGYDVEIVEGEGLFIHYEIHGWSDRKYVSLGGFREAEINDEPWPFFLAEVSVVSVPLFSTGQRPLERLDESTAPDPRVLSAPEKRLRYEQAIAASMRSSGSRHCTVKGTDISVESKSPSTTASRGSEMEELLEKLQKTMEEQAEAIREHTEKLSEYMERMDSGEEEPEEEPEEASGGEAEGDEDKPKNSGGGAEASAPAPEPVTAAAGAPDPRDAEIERLRAAARKHEAEKIVDKLMEERALDESQREELIELASTKEGLAALSVTAKAAPLRVVNAHRGQLATAGAPAPTGAPDEEALAEKAAEIQKQRIRAGHEDVTYAGAFDAARKELAG